MGEIYKLVRIGGLPHWVNVDNPTDVVREDNMLEGHIIIDDEGFILDVPPFISQETYDYMRMEVEQYFAQNKEGNINA